MVVQFAGDRHADGGNAMNWGWPQYVEFGMLFLAAGLELAKDGQPKTGKHNFFTTVLALGFAAYLLYAGGFWTPK